MKCSDISHAIEQLAPLNLAYEWDNVGLIYGDEEQQVTKVMLSLDVDIDVAEEAIAKGAQMIVAHHPILFSPINKISPKTCDGRLLRKLIKHDIAFYAAHTNLDIAKGGLNDLLASKIGLTNIQVLEHTPHTANIDISHGIGRIGDLPNPMTLCELAAWVKQVLNIQFLRYGGDGDRTVSRIAVNTGGGTSEIPAALKSGADVFITGDYKYAQVRETLAQGMSIIDAGHYDTEIIVCGLLHSYLAEKFGNTLELCISEANVNVFKGL